VSCSPQRFLANNRNLLADAELVASSVLGVENKVIPLSNPRFGEPARAGNATVALTGTYTGAEAAIYDIQIIDADVEIPRVSAPTRSGEGSGSVTDITATGSQQIFTLECQAASIEAEAASASVDGARIKAASEGTDGNALTITVDQSGLTFADTAFTTIAELEPGQGSTASPLVGAAYDWSTVQIANGLIPDSAKRIAFADDPGTVYVNYKDFVDGAYRYYLVPALQRIVPKGTLIQFVTGGRSVAVSTTLPAPATETVSDIVTLFDFLNWIRTSSELLVVDGVVTNDRSPTGQAAREFNLRTDAHAQVSSGDGSAYANGFVNVTVAAGAGTQLVTAECIAVTAADHPNARLGSELWALKSSLLGDLGIIQTGDPFSGAQFGLTIPVRLPPGYGQDKGDIGAAVEYTSRAEGETEPPICVVGLALGPDATDKTVTFKYTARPSGDCNCADMAVPNLRNSCLGDPSEGGMSVSYQNDTNARLTALRLWYKGIVRDLSKYPTDDTLTFAIQATVITNPLDGGSTEALHAAQATASLRNMINNFESTLAQIDPLPEASPPGYREAGNAAWDDAVDELQADIEAAIGAPSPFIYIRNMPSDRYDASLNWALASAGIAVVGKADASTVSGDGCWRDWGDASWWEDVDGVYAPMFSNHPYWSSRRSVGGAYYSTHEFAFQANIKCPADLKDGDTITIKILNAGWGATYQRGDTLEAAIIAAGALAFAGGVTGAPIQTWTLNGSVSGPFPSYLFNPESPAAYSGTAGGTTIGLLLVEGGIPPAKGDRFRWAVEGGHYRWRKNGGAWDGSSPPLPIPVASDPLDDGLSVSFTAGASASFVADDLYKFRATQPWAVSNLQRPTPAVWKWDGATATLESGDLGSEQQIDFFAMVHALPEGAGAVLWGGATSGATDWSEPLTWRADIIKKAMDRQARFLRLELTDAAGGSIQWAWAGVPVSTELHGDTQLIYSYQINRANEAVGGRFVGKGLSADIAWSDSALVEDEAAALIGMLDHVKENDDEPLIFIPNVERDEVVFGRINSDRVQFTDRAGYNQQARFERRVSGSLAIESALQ
jgi:hypothetical protein